VKVQFKEMDIEVQFVTEDRVEEIAEWIGGVVQGSRRKKVAFGEDAPLFAPVGEAIVVFTAPSNETVKLVLFEEQCQVLFK